MCDKQERIQLINVLSQLVLLVQVHVHAGHEAAIAESAVETHNYTSHHHSENYAERTED